MTTLATMALPAAAAQANAVWTGAGTTSEWSNATNWSGAPPAANRSAGTLTFPTLTGCAAPKTCYTSHNGLTGVSATGLVLGNTSNQYRILQTNSPALTVGTGGVSDTPGGGTGDVIYDPLALSEAQTWIVGSTINGYNSLTVLGGITSPSTAPVSVSTPRGDLFLDSNMEVGPVTSNGPGTLHIGGAPGSGHPGSVNGTNGQPLTITGGTLIPNPSSTSGPLTMNSGTTLLLGTNTTNTGATTLDVNGAATLSSSTTTKTFIDDNGSTAGTSFSQLSASGSITLGGKLVLGQGKSNGSCVALNIGDVAALVTTTGTLSGTFSNAPEGTILTMAASCQSTLPKLQIHYTGNSVSATVVGSATSTPTTTTLATPDPSPASTNQAVMLTATVSTSSATPSGTVAFSANGTTISGCTSQPVVASGTSGAATCSTSFAAYGSPESLTATFTGASGSGQASSTSSAQTLTVSQGSTTTGLSASDSSPTAGSSVTYTATVTPGTTGASKPSGTVAFQDGGNAISACSAQPLMAGSSSATATCTVTYATTGSHSMTASYGGDGNFTGSSSSTTTVNVQPGTMTTTTSLATPNPSPASTNQSVTLTATVSTSSVAPSGTVAFSANGSAIPGCTSQPVTASGSSGTATCSTAFAASGSPESLTAAFTPASGSGQAGSTSSAQTLTVNQGSTTTGLSASNTGPTAGGSVTYTATVAPGSTGATTPSGTAAFQDGSSSISTCSAQPLTAGSSSSTATCTVSYPNAGSHSITASYGGDANFTGSSSSATTVTVQAGGTTTFPTTPILDTFSQSAGPLSSNWQSPGLQDAGTVSVAASGQTISSGGAASAIWKATSFGANQEAYLTVPVLPAAGHYFQVAGRVSSLTGSTVSMYFLQVTPSKNLWDLRKKLNGASSTSMGTFTAPFAAGDSAGLQLNGSTITAWHESGGSWTSVGSVTDTSITAGGYVVFTLGDTTIRGGAFGGGNGG
ncbi:MAG TPA: Ig-like domain repeat protein [Solirubrobacteraceae bacterium]|nr:Ig-like domain repeat protein [Solirubrobacteraceae bacterium]